MSDLIWTTIPYTNLPIIVVVGLVGLWFLLRSHTTKLATSSELDALVGGERATVLQFFSNT